MIDRGTVDMKKVHYPDFRSTTIEFSSNKEKLAFDKREKGFKNHSKSKGFIGKFDKQAWIENDHSIKRQDPFIISLNELG